MRIKILVLILLVLLLAIDSNAATSIYDFNESGASSHTWPGWTWSDDVTSYGHDGWTQDSGQYMSGDWYPRSFQKTDYGTNPQASIITTDRAPSTSTGAALRIYDTGTDKQACWWFVTGNNWGTMGYADANTNRWSQYIKFSGLDNSGLLTSDPDNYNVEIGTYLCWPGGGIGGEDCPKEADGQHYYHQLNVPSGVWLHVLLDKHPSHQRGMDDSPVNDPAGPTHPYYQYFFGYYIDIPYAQNQATSWIMDEARVYPEPNTENEVSINNMWIGYFTATGKWQVGFDDLSFATYNDNSNSKHEIRWSTSPITNANWSSANTIVPEYNRYSTTNSFRRPNSWKRISFTQFDLPVGTETNNNKIYFALKDTSSTADGDNHNAPSTSVKTIDYSLAPETPVDGACGTANGQYFAGLTDTSPNLCAAGTVASFTGTGPWTWGCNGLGGGTSTSATACVAQLTGTSQIMDNTSAGVTSTGTWVTSTSYPGYYGANYLASYSGTFTWPFNIVTGTFNVYAWWQAMSARPTSVTYRVTYNGGLTDDVIVNQTVNGSQWNLLGNYLNPTKVEIVTFGSSTNGACADAVRAVEETLGVTGIKVRTVNGWKIAPLRVYFTSGWKIPTTKVYVSGAWQILGTDPDPPPEPDPDPVYTYYVDSGTAGNDANPGTIALPWKTIAKVNATSLSAGQSVGFKRDGMWQAELIPPSNGTSGSKITYGAYGVGDKPIISGGNYIAGGWALLSGTTYYKTTSLWVDRSGNARILDDGTPLAKDTDTTLNSGQYYFPYSGSPGTSGALLSGTLYVNVGHSPGATELVGNYRARSVALSGRSYIILDGLHITQAGYGISASGTFSQGNIVRNCTFDWSTMGIYTGLDATNRAYQWLVEYNAFDNIGQNITYDQVIYFKFGDSSSTFQYNTFNNPTAAYSFDINGSDNNIIRYNRSYGGQGSFLEFYEEGGGGSSNNQVYYNVVSNARSFIYAGPTANHTGNTVYNNTIYQYANGAICLDNASATLTARNNIFYSTVNASNAFYCAGSATKSNNDEDSYNPLFSDPVTGDLRLQSGSAAINAGTNVGLTQDFDGYSVAGDSTPDIGAFQYH